MIILGIGGILGDAATAIVKDGQLVAAVEEVKVARQYRVGGLPDASIASCLFMAGAKPEDVDSVAIVRPLSTGRETGLHLQLRGSYNVQIQVNLVQNRVGLRKRADLRGALEISAKIKTWSKGQLGDGHIA